MGHTPSNILSAFRPLHLILLYYAVEQFVQTFRGNGTIPYRYLVTTLNYRREL